jgi:transposase-like protein
MILLTLRVLTPLTYISLRAIFKALSERKPFSRQLGVLIALGINDKGKREVLGVQVSLSEAEVYWREFLGDLQKRGMHGTKLIISDAHSSIKAARKAIMPGVAWQRYQQ